MTLKENKVRRIVTTRKTDGRLCIDLAGTERRAFPRVADGRLKKIEDATYSTLRAANAE